ncbi:MAG TPA: hypothetical protein VFI48_11460 [Hyphomicrobiaceae bacterium]|nr:hypothetical protein [Hyphomicrobiaceae bacterium]
MMHPTVHLNGTARSDLLDGYLRARTELVQARHALYDAAPNGRDYYVQGPDAITKARDEHLARIAKIEDVIADIEALCERLV